jgi:hypothetical protein
MGSSTEGVSIPPTAPLSKGDEVEVLEGETDDGRSYIKFVEASDG